MTRVSHAPLEAWLAQRDPAPPVQLAASLRVQLARPAAMPDGGARAAMGAAHAPERAASPPGGTEAVADALVRASADSLRRLLAEGGTQRDSALELLAADALATYAFEAAADEPALLEARCRSAMRRFSEVVDGT